MRGPSESLYSIAFVIILLLECFARRSRSRLDEAKYTDAPPPAMNAAMKTKKEEGSVHRALALVDVAVRYDDALARRSDRGSDYLGHGHRAVASARAAEADMKLLLAGLAVDRGDVVEQRDGHVEEFFQRREAVEVPPHRFVLAGKHMQVVHIVRVRQEAHVEYIIRVLLARRT